MRISKFRNVRMMIVATIAAASFFCVGIGIVHADTSQSTTQGVTNQTVYKAGNNVVVTGVVNGDVYCAGQTITIDATVNGDPIAREWLLRNATRWLGDSAVLQSK